MNCNVVVFQFCRRLETFLTILIWAHVRFVSFRVLVLHVAFQPFNFLATDRAGFGAPMHDFLVLFTLSSAAESFLAERASEIFYSSFVRTADQFVLVEVADGLAAVDAEALLLLMHLPYVVLKSLRLLEHLVTIWKSAGNVWFFLVSVLEMFVEGALLDLLSTFGARDNRLIVRPYVRGKVFGAVEYFFTQ